MNDIHGALAQLLANDATLAATLQALELGSLSGPASPSVLLGNRPFQSIGQENYPCWVIEAGDAAAAADAVNDDPDGLVIGSHSQGFQAEILLALVWHQQDNTKAFQQRLALLPAVARLLMRNPDLSGTAQMAWLASQNNDRQAAHPMHVAQFSVQVLIDVRKTP